MEKCKTLLWSLGATILTMLPAQILAAGHPLEDRPAAPTATNDIVVIDDSGVGALVRQGRAEFLLVGHYELADRREGHRGDQHLSIGHARGGRPAVADDLCWAFPDVLKSSLDLPGGRRTAGSDDGNDLATNDAGRNIKPLGGDTRGLRGDEKAYYCKEAHQEGDNQVQPLQSQSGAPDDVRRGSLSSGEPLSAKIAVLCAFWALAMGLIPIGLIWLGLARTIRSQAIGCATTCTGMLGFGVLFSLVWMS